MYVASFLVLAVSLLLPLLSACSAPAAAPAPAPAPAGKPAAVDVPIKYPGDTDASIARRAQWVEGAKKEANLVFWGILPPDTAQPFIAEFNKIYPFIKVEYWRGSGEESGTKLEAEAITKKFTADVDLGSIQLNRFNVWRQNGWLTKFVQNLPNVAQLKAVPGVVSKSDDWVLPGPNAIGPQWNTTKLTAAEAPKNWDDLLDPKYKGKIGLAISTGMWETMATAEGGWGVDKTLDYCTKLRQQNIVWLQGGYLGGHGLLVAGEVSIMGNALLPHLITAQTKGAPVDWVKTGPMALTGPQLAIMNPINHPNAANLFVEWFCSPQGLLLYEIAGGKGIVYPGATTVMNKMLEAAGTKYLIHTEEANDKVLQLGLVKKFQEALGIP